MPEPQRSADARAAAEHALANLLTAGRPTSEKLIVLGGLVPPTLTATGAPDVPAHLGTTDVDVLLVTHLTAGEALTPIEAALDAMQFAPVGDGWRWRGRVDDRVVTIEFLCDLDDQPAEAIVRPHGCARLRAVNLRGTGYVEQDYRDYEFDGPDGAVQARIAGLAGYLIAKSVATRVRGADKDYYDLSYVLLHNQAGGPAAAAAAVLETTLAAELPTLQSTFLELRERFRNDRAHGAQTYAQEARKVTPEADPRLLAADASAAVNEFIDALGPI